MKPTTLALTPPPNPQIGKASTNEGPQRTRSIQDLYDLTDEVTQNFSDLT